MFADDIKLRKKIGLVQESASQELQEELVRPKKWNNEVATQI